MEMDKMKLSTRLIEIANHLPEGAKFADIGSDHAYLPCYVCLQDQTATAIAGELNEGPYHSARNNVANHGLEKRISVRLGDGLEVIREEDEIEQVVIAGMGGGLIVQILEEGKAKLKTVRRLILQPNINAKKVRKWLFHHDFDLVMENIVEENGHIYEILVADRNGNTPYNDEEMEKQFFFGPHLLREKSALFFKKWNNEREKLTRIIQQMREAKEPDHEKINQFTKELSWIKEELDS